MTHPNLFPDWMRADIRYEAARAGENPEELVRAAVRAEIRRRRAARPAAEKAASGKGRWSTVILLLSKDQAEDAKERAAASGVTVAAHLRERLRYAASHHPDPPLCPQPRKGDEGAVRLCFRLPADALAEIDSAARKSGRFRTAWIRSALASAA